MKCLEQRDSRKNEDGPQYQRPGDSEVQHSMLRLRRDFERLKNQQENKNIVHAERLFHQVGGEKLYARQRAAGEVQPKVEKQGNADPCRAFNQGFLQLNCVRLAMKHAKVQHERYQDRYAKNHPDVYRRSHHVCLSQARAARV